MPQLNSIQYVQGTGPVESNQVLSPPHNTYYYHLLSIFIYFLFMKEGSSRHCCMLQHWWWQDTSSKVAILSDMATTLAAMFQLLLLLRNLEKRRPHAPFQSTRLRYTWVWSTQFRRKRTRESKFRYTTIDKSKSCIIQNQPIPYKYSICEHRL